MKHPRSTVAKSPQALDVVHLLLEGLSRLSDDKSYEALIRILVKIADKDAENQGDEGKDRIWRVLVKFGYDELERASSPSRT
jgi:hypothetical protein